MAVTARLSTALYDRFGDEIVGELVDWLNQVDATYRHDLRELNELNFARFDARLEQRIGELRNELSERLSAIEIRMGQRFSELGDRMASLEVRVERALKDQSRSMIGIWMAVLLAVGSLWLKH